MAAQHRHVAGMVADAVFLLERPVVLLVDDDQTEVLERQEQRRPGADHDGRPASRHLPPGPAFFRPAHVRMPAQRRGAEAFLEAAEPLGAERDFRQQHQALPPGPQRRRDGVEIHLRLARPRHPLEQGAAVGVLADPAPERGGGRRLVRRQVGRRIAVSRVGACGRNNLLASQRARIQQPLDHRAGDTCLLCQVRRLKTAAVGNGGEHLLPRVGQLEPRRPFAGRQPGNRARRLQRLGHGHCHAQHRSLRRHGVGRHPVDELAMLVRQRRRLQPLDHVLQLLRRDVAVAVSPNDPGTLPRAERHGDEVAGRKRHARRHRIVVGARKRQRQQRANSLCQRFFR